MFRTTALLTLGAAIIVNSQTRAEDPKFAQLKTKHLITAKAPDLKGGLVFPGGAIDLSADPSAMILATFKSEGARFVHVKMIYKGEYTDPNAKIEGYLYHLKDETYDRYFFVSKIGVTGPTDLMRYVIDYDDQGVPLAYFRGKFALRP
jgi:hypothetical protein